MSQAALKASRHAAAPQPQQNSQEWRGKREDGEPGGSLRRRRRRNLFMGCDVFDPDVTC